MGSNDIVTALAVLANAILPRLLAGSRAGVGGCAACEGKANGVMYCFDSAVHVLPFPTTGDGWVLHYTPGVGLDWLNEAEIGPPAGRAARKPKE